MRCLSGPGSAKPLRADARRNRARLLEAAEQVFAEKGIGASTEEIARQAGVGIGTVFRHFPTKEALLKAVFLGRLARLGEEAAALAESQEPGPAFFAFFTHAVDQSSAKSVLVDALEAAGVNVEAAVSEVAGQLDAVIGGLLANAQRVGAVRADIGADELKALLVGASRAVEQAGVDPGTRARTLAVLLDGLRPPAASRPPA
ncbi:TetR/AcrR family transcriptional regulator [Streptacidiphilus sp. N1-12]|uniref:TetR/AcrR family transcriptional regulator n=2 Tax=Streptacidiphilus alkalitolerans TaxID=3342712 RepID=A0ABV6VD04_9ACTN